MKLFLPHGPLLSAADAERVRPSAWTRSPLDTAHLLDSEALRTLWPRLHDSTALWPANPDLLAGWLAFHNGDFAQAALHAEALGDAGLPLLNQATAVYASYVEPREATRLALLHRVVEGAQRQLQAQPDDTHALYWLAYALSRHAQAVSVARTLAQGLGSQIKHALEHLIALRPDHAEAHVALGAFHAEVIDKVGPLVGRMTYGVRADAAEALFVRGLALQPESASGCMAWAHALLVLHGPGRLDEATALYERAAAITPLDARQRMDQALAQLGLDD